MRFLVGCWVASMAAMAVQGQLVVVEHSAGSCHPYPEDGQCSGVGLSGVPVFLFDQGVNADDRSSDFTAREAAMKAWMDVIIGAAQSLVGPDCVEPWRLMACYAWYPPCTPDDLPSLPCKSSCESAEEKCAVVYNVARQTGLGGTLPDCANDLVGDPKSSFSGFGVDYLASMKGQKIFADDSAGASCASTEGLDWNAAGCKARECAAPFVERRLPLQKYPKTSDMTMANPEDLEFCANMSNPLDCTRCQSMCEWPCPYPILYDEQEQTAQWVAIFLPGLLGLPLNMLVMWSEVSKIRRMKKFSSFEVHILISSLLAFTLVMFESLPVLALREDTGCAGRDTFNPRFNGFGHESCGWRKMRVHVLQALMFSVVVNMDRVNLQVKASRKMQKFMPGPRERYGYFFLVFGVPTILAIITEVLQSNVNIMWHMSDALRTFELGLNGSEAMKEEFTPMYHPNKIRFMYTCGPFYDNILQEMLVVTIPTLVGAVWCTFLSVKLFLSLRQASREQMSTSMTASMKGSKSAKKDILYRMARGMLRFAVVAVAMCVLNILATAMYFSVAEAFAIELNLFSNCAFTGLDQKKLLAEGEKTPEELAALVDPRKTLNATLERCGEVKDTGLPATALLVLVSLSQTVPGLAFGVVFAFPALRQLQYIWTRRLTSILPSSVGPTSSGRRRSSSAGKSST